MGKRWRALWRGCGVDVGLSWVLVMHLQVGEMNRQVKDVYSENRSGCYTDDMCESNESSISVENLTGSKKSKQG